MMRSLPAALLLLTCGCVPLDVFQTPGETAMVPSSPLTTPTQAPAATKSFKASPSSPETALLVDRIGNQLLRANKQLNIKPAFLTISAPKPEMFHQGTGIIYITDSLVRQCKTETQLAALLSVELGRMISEREAQANPELSEQPKRLPLTVQIGNAAQFSGTEQLYAAEVAKLDADRRQPLKKFVPPSPEVLARKYLEAAGVDLQELATVAPLLQEADRNYVLEKQFKAATDTTTWAPR